jgi:hypothetical protein
MTLTIIGGQSIKNDNMDEAVFRKFLTTALQSLYSVTEDGGCLNMACADQTDASSGSLLKKALQFGVEGCAEAVDVY